eukprot:UN09572
MKISDLSASTNPKKDNFSSNPIFKLGFPNCIFELQSPRLFRQIFRFQVMKNWLKKNRRILAHFEKMNLLVKWAKANVFFMFLSSSICKMEVNNIAGSFPTYRILAFEV